MLLLLVVGSLSTGIPKRRNNYKERTLDSLSCPFSRIQAPETQGKRKKQRQIDERKGERRRKETNWVLIIPAMTVLSAREGSYYITLLDILYYLGPFVPGAERKRRKKE